MITTIYSNDDSIDWGVTGDERIVQNARNILRTRMYEVPFMRDLGINSDFIDAASHKIKTEFITHITEVIEANEDRASVKDVRLESCGDNGDYVIAVDLEV